MTARHLVVVDSHVHVVSPDTDRFPTRPAAFAGDWWRGDVSAKSLAATLDAHGVDRAVVVQAVGIYGYDCSYAIAAVAEDPGRLALVGAVDMDARDPVGALEGLAATARHRGVRLGGVRVFGVAGDEPRWLTDGRADAVWECAGEQRVTVVPVLFADRLSALGRVTARHGNVPVALDHCGFPDPDSPFPDGALLALAELPSVTLKVTSHVLDTGADGGDPARRLDRLVEAFGAERLCWGSDHPQHRRLSYREMVDLARRSARHLHDGDVERFLAGTAHALWWRDDHRRNLDST